MPDRNNGPLSLKKCKDREKKAYQFKERWRQLTNEVYEFAAPYRNADVTLTPGQPRTDRLFDGTAPTAAFRFAGRIQRDVTPPFSNFYELKAGPLIEDRGERKKLDEQFAVIGEKSHALLSTGNFHVQSHESYFDLFCGTSAILMLDVGPPSYMKFVAVPVQQLAIETGPFGDVWGIHWRRKHTADEVKDLWPDATIEQKLADRMKSSDDKEDIQINQYTRFDPKEKAWFLYVYWTEGETFLWNEKFRVPPWLLPRFFVVPEERYGRGPVHLALPFIKTANKARELALQAAAFSIFGIFTAIDDGVFNPDTARFAPATFWKVQRNGGGLGPSLARMPIPADFDISTIVLDDERQQIKQALFDDTLPPDAGAVRSATEIVERMKRLQRDLGGVYGRLTMELLVPLAQRVIDVLETHGLLGTNLTIDQVLVRLNVIAPIAKVQMADDVQSFVDWATIVSSFMGQEGVAMLARIEQSFQDIGRMMGVDERHLRDETEVKQFQEQLAQAMAANATRPGQTQNGAAPQQLNGAPA